MKAKSNSYPSFQEYDGGGIILNRYTSPKNIELFCPKEIRQEVMYLIESGRDVLIADDQIKAVR